MIHSTALVHAVVPTDQLIGDPRHGRLPSPRPRHDAPGTTSVEPLTDLLVHGQDIALPLGREGPVPPAAAAISAAPTWGSRPFCARRRMRGLSLSATDHPWQVGKGDRIEGSTGDLLLPFQSIMVGHRAEE
jgi:hypothetical protein